MSEWNVEELLRAYETCHYRLHNPDMEAVLEHASKCRECITVLNENREDTHDPKSPDGTLLPSLREKKQVVPAQSAR